MNGYGGLGLLVETGLLERTRDTVENLLWCPSLTQRAYIDKEVFVLRIIEDQGTAQSFGYQQRWTDGDVDTTTWMGGNGWSTGPSTFDLSQTQRSYLSDVWFGTPDDPHEGRWRTWYLDAHVEANPGPDDVIPVLSWNDHYLGWRSLDPD